MRQLRVKLSTRNELMALETNTIVQPETIQLLDDILAQYDCFSSSSKSSYHGSAMYDDDSDDDSEEYGGGNGDDEVITSFKLIKSPVHSNSYSVDSDHLQYSVAPFANNPDFGQFVVVLGTNKGSLLMYRIERENNDHTISIKPLIRKHKPLFTVPITCLDAIRVSSNRIRVVACSEEGSIRVINYSLDLNEHDKNQMVTCEISARETRFLSIQSVHFLSASNSFVTLTIAGDIQVWREGMDGQFVLQHLLREETAEENDDESFGIGSYVSMDVRDDLIAVGDSLGTLTIWDLSNVSNHGQNSKSRAPEPIMRLKPGADRTLNYKQDNEWIGSIEKIAFHANPNILFTGSTTGQLVSWSLENRISPASRWIQVSSPVIDFDYDPSGIDFIFLTDDQRVHFTRFGGQ